MENVLWISIEVENHFRMSHCLVYRHSSHGLELFISVHNVTSSTFFWRYMWDLQLQRLLRWIGALMVSQTYLFLFHHSHWWRPNLSCFFLWFASGGLVLRKVVTLVSVRVEGKKRGVRRGEGRCREGRRSSEKSHVVNVRSRKVSRSGSERSLRWLCDLQPAWGATHQALQRGRERKVSHTWWNLMSVDPQETQFSIYL